MAKHQELLVAKGQLLLARGGVRHSTKALSDFIAAARLDPSHAETQLVLARVRVSARRLKELGATSSAEIRAPRAVDRRARAPQVQPQMSDECD